MNNNLDNLKPLILEDGRVGDFSVYGVQKNNDGTYSVNYLTLENKETLNPKWNDSFRLKKVQYFDMIGCSLTHIEVIPEFINVFTINNCKNLKTISGIKKINEFNIINCENSILLSGNNQKNPKIKKVVFNSFEFKKISFSKNGKRDLKICQNCNYFFQISKRSYICRLPYDKETKGSLDSTMVSQNCPFKLEHLILEKN